MVVSGSRKRWDWSVAYNPPIGSIYHLYTTYILPSGVLYATYHLLGEPETSIEFLSGLIYLMASWLGFHLFHLQKETNKSDLVAFKTCFFFFQRMFCLFFREWISRTEGAWSCTQVCKKKKKQQHLRHFLQMTSNGWITANNGRKGMILILVGDPFVPFVEDPLQNENKHTTFHHVLEWPWASFQDPEANVFANKNR